MEAMLPVPMGTGMVARVEDEPAKTAAALLGPAPPAGMVDEAVTAATPVGTATEAAAVPVPTTRPTVEPPVVKATWGTVSV